MTEFDQGTLLLVTAGEHAYSLLPLALDAMFLQPAAFQQIAAHDRIASMALAIPFLAGASELLGQSFILIANRTPIYRFLLSLAITGILYLSAGVAWIASASALADWYGKQAIEFWSLAGVVAVGFSPRLFSFFAIAPYYGPGLSRLLDAWTLACVTYGVKDVSGIGFVHAAICGVTGWVVFLTTRAVLGRIATPVLRRAHIAAVGTPLAQSPHELAAQIRQSIENVFNSERPS